VATKNLAALTHKRPNGESEFLIISDIFVLAGFLCSLLPVTMTQEEEDRKVKERAKHGSSRSSTSADDKESKLRVRPRRSGASKPGAVPETSSSRGSEKAPRDDESRSHRAKSSRSGSSGPGAVPETSSSRGSEKARRDDESRSGRSDRRKPAVEASSSSVSSGTASPNSRKERMVSRQREDQEAKSRAKRSMTDGSVVSIGTRFGGGSRHNHSRHEERDTVAKNAARLPRSTATSIEPGAESVSMESPRTTSSKSRSKAGYPPSFADDDRAAGLKAPPFAAAVPNSPSGEKGETPSRNMLQKDLSAVELQATLVEEEGEDRKLKRLVEMERRLKQQMQDLHQHQTQPQTQDLNAAIVGNADSPSPAEEGNRSKKRGIIVGVIVLVLAIGGGIAGFFFSQKDSNDETPLASNPTDAPTVPGNPTVPPIMSMLTDMPTADLSYDPPSRAECRVMEQGGTLDVGQNVIIKDFVVQLDVMISVQTSESLWLDELKQRLQEKVVPDLVGCFDVQRNLGERDESSLPQVDRKLNEGSRYVVKFGLVEAVLGRSCTEPSSLCKRVDVSLTLFLKGDENNLFFYGLISNSFGATSDDSLVQILDLRTPISSIGVEGVSTGALTEAPTPLPTSELTKNPTPAPTKTPTLAPTKNPTKSPTHAPEPTTEAPTRAPTTERPTSAPEPGATPQPTSTPTCVNMDSFFARNRYDEEDGASDESYQVDCDSDTALVVLTRDENSCQVTCRASRSYNSVFDQLCDDNGDVTVLLQGDYRGQTLYIGQLDDGVSFNCPQALMLATPEPTKDPTPDPSPSPTPDPTPPPTTVQPTAEPTTFCEDYSNWVDSYGDTCKSFYSTDAECQGNITSMEQVVNNVCIISNQVPVMSCLFRSAQSGRMGK
jgi:outer membrane biosynthesis protein TonB